MPRKWLLWSGVVLSSSILVLSFWLWRQQKQRPLVLHRRFEMAEMAQVEAQGTAAIKPYDEFSYGHTGYFEPEVEKLAKAGDKGYRYYNILTNPLPEWVGQGDPWFDWADSVIVGEWGAVLRTADGLPARYRYYGGPKVFNWAELGKERHEAIADRQIELMGATKNVFLDVFFLLPATWMTIEHVAEVDSLPFREAWQKNITAYQKYLKLKLGSNAVVVNGDRKAEMPMNLENAQDHWAQDVALWRQHPENILSVDLGTYEDSLLTVWLKYGGKIYLSTALDYGWRVTQPFYERAAKERELK